MTGQSGDPRDLAELLPAVYEELRRLAAKYMSGERRSHTLQPTALVHEAYVRLVARKRLQLSGKTHLIALAAKEMRRILVDHARKRLAAKRHWGKQVTLDESAAVTADRTVDVIALDEALRKLSSLDPRQSEVAELRIFAGLTEEELAAHFGLSDRTIREDWRVARAWLSRELAA